MNTEPSPIRTALLVGLGAGLGALARAIILFFAEAGTTREVLFVLAVNVLGCLLMGLFKPGAFAGAGLLGGFTTFSAVALASVQTSAIWALIYMLVSFVLCVGAWIVGDTLREERHA